MMKDDDDVDADDNTRKQNSEMWDASDFLVIYKTNELRYATWHARELWLMAS